MHETVNDLMEDGIPGGVISPADQALAQRDLDEEQQKAADDIDARLIKKREKKMTGEERWPAVYHIVTKRDLMTEEGYAEYLVRLEDLKKEGLLDKYFFVSSLTAQGLKPLEEELFLRRNSFMEEHKKFKDPLNPRAAAPMEQGGRTQKK